MNKTAAPSCAWSLDSLPNDERQRALDTVARLKMAPADSPAPQPLRGRNLAVLCDGAHCNGLSALQGAAEALGAKVVHIRPRVTQLSKPQQIDALAKMLGQLYDAIDCHAMAPALVERLKAGSGKPVFSTSGCSSASDDDNDTQTRLQAWLLVALSR